MSAGIAVIMIAHENPAQLRRLIETLDGLDVFLHYDRKTRADVAAAIPEGKPDVFVLPRRDTARMSWSLVEVELAGLQAVLERSRAEHIVVISGSCYPLVSVSDMQDELAGWRGLSRLELNPVPRSLWDYPIGRPDGGLWRFNRRFLTLRGQIVTFRELPIPLWHRDIPPELRLHGCSQWKIYARSHASKLLSVLNRWPDLVRYWRSTYAPEESAVASILTSPALVGSVADELRHNRMSYIDWSENKGGHPRWLELADFPALREARTLPALRPEDPHELGDDARRLFARKFKAGSGELLDRIDAELRV
jgi:hypothetical protein